MRARYRPIALLAALAAVAAAAPGAPAAGGARTTAVALAPAPGDLALLAISFPHGGRRRLDSRSLRVAVRGAFGDDYLALAAPLPAVPRPRCCSWRTARRRCSIPRSFASAWSPPARSGRRGCTGGRTR